MTEEDRDLILRLWREGRSAREIADRLGRSESAIHRIRKLAGMYPRTRDVRCFR